MSKLSDAWELVANYCLLAHVDNGEQGFGPFQCVPKPNGRAKVSGLCGIAIGLHDKRYITSESFSRILAAIQKLPRQPVPQNAFRFPRTLDGWRARYWFCKRQAAKAAKKSA